MKNILGEKGEKLAQEFLKKNKFKILATNYETQIGEIDIIAKIKDVIVFVEVKTRTSTKFGNPRYSVTTFKQNKIKQVSTIFLIKNNLLEAKCRFDVIDILNSEITHITNAF